MGNVLWKGILGGVVGEGMKEWPNHLDYNSDFELICTLVSKVGWYLVWHESKSLGKLDWDMMEKRKVKKKREEELKRIKWGWEMTSCPSALSSDVVRF